MNTFLLKPLLWAFLFCRQGTEAQRIQLKTSKASVCWHLLKSRAIKSLNGGQTLENFIEEALPSVVSSN